MPPPSLPTRPTPRSKYQSFLRSLSYYNFKRQPRPDHHADSCEYVHNVLHRDFPERTAHIVRKPNASAKARVQPQGRMNMMMFPGGGEEVMLMGGGMGGGMGGMGGAGMGGAGMGAGGGGGPTPADIAAIAWLRPPRGATAAQKRARRCVPSVSSCQVCCATPCSDSPPPPPPLPSSSPSSPLLFL